MTTTGARPAAGEREYRSFPDRAHRNAAQRWIELPLFLALLRVPHDVRILEVGCGRGVALPVVSARRRPSRLVGLDCDESLLEAAAARVAGLGVELVRGDVRAMPFANASFDVVIDFGTLFHVPAPDAALREIARVLVPGGRFCLETPLSQVLSHPLRRRGRTIPWEAAPELRAERSALLWCSRRLSDRANAASPARSARRG